MDKQTKKLYEEFGFETRVEKAGVEAYSLGGGIIRGGGLVAFPTETVYGLGANALEAEAVARIFKAKGRPQDNPLIVHVADREGIFEAADVISEAAGRLIDAFMPGPITIVLKKSEKIPFCVTAGLESVGVRMPAKPEAREFLRACGVPVAAPSANISTKISPTSAGFVYEHMRGRIPLIIDAGDCEVGIESTVVDMSGEKPIILRPGAITAEMIADVLSGVGTFKGGDMSKLPSPGMRYRHYAPCCQTVVARSTESAAKYYDELQKQGLRPVILCKSENAKNYANRSVIALGFDEKEVCRSIYGALHRAEQNFDAIICEDLGYEGVYASIMNRVAKAAGGTIV